MISTFNEYDEEKEKYKYFDYSKIGILYPAIGLAEEAGEVCGCIKKAIRDNNSNLNKKEILYELGDVLWYLSCIANEIGYSLEDVSNSNLNKLKNRSLKTNPFDQESF